MCVYNCHAVLTTAIHNRSYKEMIQAFAELIEELTSRGISPGFHFIDNEASTAFKMEMTTMEIKYHLVPPNNHRINNA